MKKSKTKGNDNANIDLTLDEQIAIFAELVVDLYLNIEFQKTKSNGSKSGTNVVEFSEQENSSENYKG